MQHVSSAWFSLLPSGSQPPVLRLYCFPYAGAGHTVFQHWRAGLPGYIELALIKLPGRGARFGEPRAASLAELAEALAVAITQASTDDVPFAFFGHSMGALLAFETARRLARQELSPTQLLVSARTAPVAHGWRERVADLPPARFLEVIRDMNGMPRELLDNPEWVELFLPIIRDDFALCEDYRYSAAPPLSCPIHVLAGETDASVPLSLLDGWAQESQVECRTWLFPGGHFYLFEQEAELLALMQRLVLGESLKRAVG
ncbi:thioesterase II family protein [Pseudomonas sp. NCHU5208]|uniref:thioesterase II family protein n=1 Tax=unclassified Pseudomonas TaxID=196821 RepID=UPI003F998179